MSQYVIKIKKGEFEIELSSDDIEFIEAQLSKWRNEVLEKDKEK